MGRNKFFDRVRDCGVGEFKPQGGAWSFEVTWKDPRSATRSHRARHFRHLDRHLSTLSAVLSPSPQG